MNQVRSYFSVWVLALFALLAGFTGSTTVAAEQAPAQQPRTVSLGGGHFILDGQPVQIISGSIHFARVPQADWPKRLAMARAMGLNAISVYVFWNIEEPQPNQWDFTGQGDVAQFIRDAQKAGLYVILRPGPYACAEWSLGGYPAWLLHQPAGSPKMCLRTATPAYLKAAQSYLQHLGQQLKPLLWTNGGPIIAVQVENEYGSFGKDQAYLEDVRKMVVEAGFGSVALYTADGPGLWTGAIPELPEAIDVGPGGVEDGVHQLLKFRPHTPLVYIAEYYPGWFDAWGKPHAHGAPMAQQLKDLQWALVHGYSFNLYMFHGGTDWGFMNGANDNGKDTDYAAQTTSYDYAAPLNEAGDPTPAYYAFRKLFMQYAPDHKLPAVPQIVPHITIAPFTLPESASLWSSLPAPRKSEHPLSFSDFDQQTGYMLYRTRIKGQIHGTLDVGLAHDYDVVYLNGKEIGTLDRRLNQHALTLSSDKTDNTLEILDEDTGRINYGPLFPTDRVGLVLPVKLDGQLLTGWLNYSLPMQQEPVVAWSRKQSRAPAFHRGTFTLTKVGDTYLDVSELGKGLLWVNGHAVGRIWRIGPQQSDYIPACWLHKGVNTVTVFDLQTETNPKVWGVTQPVYEVRAGS